MARPPPRGHPLRIHPRGAQLATPALSLTYDPIEGSVNKMTTLKELQAKQPADRALVEQYKRACVATKAELDALR